MERLDERWFEANLFRLKDDALLARSSEGLAEAEAYSRHAVAREQSPIRGSFAWPGVLPRCGATRSAAPTHTICSRRSTAGSAKVSRQPI
jgi:hypothetical protein